jgi:TolA-binding protein
MKYILTFILLTSAVLAFAESSSVSDSKSSSDAANAIQVQIPSVASEVTSADTQSSYLYDLRKLIAKSREIIKEVNEKIKEQAVLKRNQAREERSRQYYEKGVELTNEGKLDEARDYFEKAILITEHPEMAGYIKESQRRLRKQQSALQAQERVHYKQIKEDERNRREDVEAAYKEAVDLYKKKKYHPAKDAFDHVDQLSPDYRATSSYLKIIDQDIIMADALAAKQQAAEIKRQQKEAEIARAKEKAVWLKQIDEKEKERKDRVNKQAEDVYEEAVNLYKRKKFAEAKKKFEEVSWVIPNYKATMKYLGRIDRDAQQQQKEADRQKQKALQQQGWEQEVEHKKQEVQHERERKAKELQHQKELGEQAEFLYAAAVKLYDNKDMDQAWDKFNDIEKIYPGYKSTRSYMIHIDQWQMDHHLPVKKRVKAPPPQPAEEAGGQPSSALEDQQKQVHDIEALAEKSTQLYQKLADIADDRATKLTKRKMAEVEKILNRLKQDKEGVLYRMQQEQRKAQQEHNKAQEVQRRAEFENNEKTQAQHANELQVQERQQALLNSQREQQQQRETQQQQKQSIKDLAQKASDINDDIIQLTRQQDYEAVKAKFTELENTITALTTVKDQIAQKKNRQRREKQSDRQTMKRYNEMLKIQTQKSEKQETRRPASTGSFTQVSEFKRRELVQEQNSLFKDAVNCYERKQYTQAKLLFGELAGQNDRRAEGWLKKVDRAMTREFLKRKEAQERQRTAFIEDQIKAQRQLIKIQERERQRQKQLTEELERQKRDFEDDRLRQLSKEQLLKAQVIERENQEEKRLRTQKENAKSDQLLRFHKIETTSSTPEVEKVPGKPGMSTQREAVHRELVNGVETMYQEALKLYQQGHYTAAADRFKDVQEILPGYKNVEQYMDDANSKALNVPAASSSPVSRQDTISKALDLFEPKS